MMAGVCVSRHVRLLHRHHESADIVQIGTGSIWTDSIGTKKASSPLCGNFDWLDARNR